MGRLSDELAITAGGAIFQRLRQLGVDVVLVNSGTDFPPIIEGLAEAETHDIGVPRSIVVPHEHVAMGIAHGYYVASGRAQAVMLHTNVGLANGAIGAINMATDHIPVILMSGRTPTMERGRFGARTVPIGWGQEMRDQAALVREATKWDYEVRFPEQVPELLDRAYAIAMSTPKGPVYLSLPREVLCEPCPAEALGAPITMHAASIVAAPDQLAAAAELLAGAERPLIVAQRGAGSPAGFEALARIAEQWSIPVCQYWANAPAISTEHPMYVGQDPAPWVAEADVILVIDSLAPWMPDVHEPAAGCKVVHLGPNPLYSRFPVRNFRSDLAITTEVGDGLVALERAMRDLASGADAECQTRRLALVDDRNATRREQSRADVAAGSRHADDEGVGIAVRGRGDPRDRRDRGLRARLHVRPGRPDRPRLVAAGAALGRTRVGAPVCDGDQARRSRPPRPGHDGRRFVHVRQPGRLSPRRRGARHPRPDRRAQQRRLRRGAPLGARPLPDRYRPRRTRCP